MYIQFVILRKKKLSKYSYQTFYDYTMKWNNTFSVICIVQCKCSLYVMFIYMKHKIFWNSNIFSIFIASNDI